LERYTLLALTGLATHEMDDDGIEAGVTPEYITADQSIQITDLIKETGSKVDAFLKYMKAESVETILAADYNKAIIALNKKKKSPQREPGADDD
jgi:hypothetical protein